MCKCGDGSPVIRCEDCHGRQLHCVQCTRDFHSKNDPLHRVQVSSDMSIACLISSLALQRWNGKFFEHTTLFDLGVIVSLGHDPGEVCTSPVHRTMTVFHSNGIHQVRVSFCGCRIDHELRRQLLRVAWWPATPLDPRSAATFAVLRQFHYLNLQGNLTAYDFYQSLEFQTDGRLRVDIPVCLCSIDLEHRLTFLSQDRLQSWMVMVREWRNVKALKRAGRVHDPEGVHTTSRGELAVRCRACPDQERNLPSGWSENEKWG